MSSHTFSVTERTFAYCSNAGVSDTVFLKLGDATRPETYPSEPFDTIIVNLPYGVRMVPEGGMKRFYTLFLKALRELFQVQSSS